VSIGFKSAAAEITDVAYRINLRIRKYGILSNLNFEISNFKYVEVSIGFESAVEFVSKHILFRLLFSLGGVF
jgi:hypothetical protein